MFEQVHNFFKQMKSFYWRFPSQTENDVTKEDVTLLEKMFEELAQTINMQSSNVWRTMFDGLLPALHPL